MIDQYIFEVFQRDKKVFLPDFGAFIYSAFNDAVDFNDLLTFDDGKVVAEIQKQQSISENEARNALNNYIQDIKNTLDQGKLHFIEGFGYLAKEENGAVTLRKAAHDDMDDSESASGRPDDDIFPLDPSSSSDNEANDNDIPSPFEKQEQQDWNNLLTDNETDGFQEEPSELPADEDETFSFGASNEEVTADAYEEELEIDYTEKKGNRALKTAVWMLIPILLLAAAAFYYFSFYEGQEIAEQRELPKTISEALLVKTPEQPESEKAPAEEEPKTSPSVEQASQNESKAVSEDSGLNITAEDEAKTYCLVLGSFKEERNADKYLKRLQSGGMVTSKFKGRNDFYFVGIENIPGKSKAIKQLSNVKADHPNAWIINRERI